MWPFKPSQPPVETKSLAAPDEELLAILGATVTGTAAASSSVALTVPAVSAAVRVLSEAAATLDVRVQRKDGDAWVDDEEHPAWWLLRGDACPWASGFEVIRDLVAEALTRDAGGLAWVNRVNGKPVEIIHYRDHVISVEYADTGEPTYRLSGKVVLAADIIHLTGPFAKSPLNMANEAIGVAHKMEQHAAKLFTNGARPAGVLQFPAGVKLGDTALGKIKAGWQAAFGGSGNGSGTAITWDGAEWKPLTFSSVDSQFQELRTFQVQEIARAFRVPPGMLYEMSRQTWSNMSQATREFLVFSLEPWLRSLEAALTRALIAPGDRRTFRIWFERDDLTRADIGERATAYSSLITSRIINPNEARDWEGMPPYPEGNEFANPNVTGAKPANDNKPAKAAAA
ncbi:phage portal protein [Mesorhizobium sp. M0317]|uniref:phage portal protein n=1 Tax=Mesorhizobium sp. M0317 TaxID=2956935 RepID=UPI003336CBDA